MRLSILVALGCSAAGLASAASPTTTPQYEMAGSIAGPDGSWDYASVDPKTEHLYVARADGVTVVNLKDDTVMSWTGVARGHAVVPLSAGRVLVTSGNDATVRWFDASTGRQVGSVAVGRKPDAAITDPARNHVLVMNAAEGTVSVVDPVGTRVVSTIKVKPGLEYAAVAGTTLFINNEDANETEVVDLANGTMGTPVPLKGCEGPTGLAYDKRSQMLVSACANGKAAVVDAKSRRLLSLLDIGRGPDAVIVDEARRLAFVPCGRDGVLDILSLDGPGGIHRVGRVTTELGARTGALDPSTGIIYLPTARFAPPASPGGRPLLVPGSFHILVVRPKS